MRGHRPELTASDSLRVPRSLPLLIAVLCMIGPFAIDTYLPSFPEMAISLRATSFEIQQSLSIYLVAFALMSLWHGAISDAIGRRIMVLLSLALLTVISIGCALAPSIEVLWIFRALQGAAAGAGLVVGRAIIRDAYEGHLAQRAMSQVTVIFTIAPAIAPVLGGYLHEWFGWRSVFYFLAGFSVLLGVWCWFALPETLPPAKRQPLHPRFLLQSYFRALTSLPFVAVAVAAACNFTALFLYISAAPVFLMTHLHLSETEFYWLFVPGTVGMLIGASLSGHFAGRVSQKKTVLLGYAIMIFAAILNVAFHAVRDAALPWSVVPIFLHTIGMACAMPSLVLVGLDLFPAQRGMASSCQIFLMSCINAFTAGVLAPLAQTTPLRLAVFSAGLVAIGVGATAYCLTRGAKREAEKIVTPEQPPVVA